MLVHERKFAQTRTHSYTRALLVPACIDRDKERKKKREIERERGTRCAVDLVGRGKNKNRGRARRYAVFAKLRVPPRTSVHSRKSIAASTFVYIFR